MIDQDKFRTEDCKAPLKYFLGETEEVDMQDPAIASLNYVSIEFIILEY